MFIRKGSGHQLAISLGHQLAISLGHQLAISLGHQLAISLGHQLVISLGHQLAIIPRFGDDNLPLRLIIPNLKSGLYLSVGDRFWTKKFGRKKSDEKIPTKKNWGQGTGARHG